MNGWSIIFAAAAGSSAIWGIPVQPEAATFATALFAILFFLTLFTRAIRGTAC